MPKLVKKTIKLEFILSISKHIVSIGPDIEPCHGAYRVILCDRHALPNRVASSSQPLRDFASTASLTCATLCADHHVSSSSQRPVLKRELCWEACNYSFSKRDRASEVADGLSHSPIRFRLPCRGHVVELRSC